MPLFVSIIKRPIGFGILAASALALAACGSSHGSTMAAGTDPNAAAQPSPSGDTGSPSGGSPNLSGSGVAGANGSGSGDATNMAGGGTGASGTNGSGIGSGAGGGALHTANTVGGDVAGGALHTTGSALVGTSNLLAGVAGNSEGTPVGSAAGSAATATQQLGTSVAAAGGTTSANGLTGLPVAGQPVESVVTSGDQALNPLAKVTVLDHTVIGSPNPNSVQLLNASVLSTASPNNAAIGAGVLANGKVLSAVVDPHGANHGSGTLLSPVVNPSGSGAGITGTIGTLAGGATSVASSGGLPGIVHH